MLLNATSDLSYATIRKELTGDAQHPFAEFRHRLTILTSRLSLTLLLCSAIKPFYPALSRVPSAGLPRLARVRPTEIVSH